MSLQKRDLEQLFGPQCKTLQIQDVRAHQTVDFTALNALVIQKEAELAQAGVHKHSRYLLEGTNTLSFFVTLFALWKLHAHPFILNPDMTEHERFLIQNRVSQQSSPLPDDTAFVLLTSGTTAEPKAVVHTIEGLLKRLEILNLAIPVSDRAKTICLLPLYFGHGLIGLSLLSLYSGQHLILTPALSLQNLDQLPGGLKSTQPSFISSSPAIWEILLRAPVSSDMNLKRVQIASAPTHHNLFDRIKSWARCPLYNVYGLTECASWISDSLYQNQEVSVGDGQKWNTKFRISAPDADGIGSIEIQIPGFFWGYWDYSGPAYMETDSWFKTGDYGYIKKEGELYLVGRESRIINRKGLKVSAEEVEKYILDISDIADAAVLAIGADSSEVGALIVTKKPIQISQIVNHLKSKISQFKIPSEFKMTDSIPRKPNGKPDLTRIKDLWKTL